MFLVELNDGDCGIIEKLPENIAGAKMFEQGLSEGTQFEKISGSPISCIVTISVGDRYFAITNDIAEALSVKRCFAKEG